MTERKFKAITKSLNIAQAMMVQFGISESEIFEMLMEISPFDYEEDDEGFLTAMVDGLNQMSETKEHYEICSFLQTIKQNIK